MGKIITKIGFSITSETAPGVWTEQIVERKYSGDILKNIRKWSSSENLNDNLTINNQFSIIADSFIKNNIGSMRYIIFGGTKWSVSNIDIQYPRLILTTGGIYNG